MQRDILTGSDFLIELKGHILSRSEFLIEFKVIRITTISVFIWLDNASTISKSTTSFGVGVWGGKPKPKPSFEPVLLGSEKFDKFHH